MEHKINRKFNQTIDIGNSNHRNDARILLAISTLYTVAVALSDTFVNVYLWKIEQDYYLIGWFNLYQYIAIFISFIVAGKLAKKIDRVILLRFGVLVLTLFFLLVLLFGENTSDHYVVLGLLLGIGEGFYWFSYNILYFEITDPDNRDGFNGWNGLLTSSGGIIAPFLSGWFISTRKGISGYKAIFFISLAIFFIAAVISFWFFKRKSFGEYRLKTAFRGILHKNNLRNVFFAMIAQGGREGVIIFLIGLLVYISTNDEFSLGTYTMTISGIASLTYFIAGKYMREKWRNTSMLLGTIMMAIVVMPMFFDINLKTLFIYGIGTSLFAPLYFIPLTSKTFDVIGESKESAALRGEYIVVRETGLNIGRVAITLIFIYMISIGTEYLKYLLLFSGSLQILAGYFMRKVNSNN